MEKYILFYKVVSGLERKLKRIIANRIVLTIFCLMLCNVSVYASDMDTPDYDAINSEIENIQMYLL